MKFGPVTRFYERNKATSKKIEDNIMLKNCEVIAVFPIYSQFGETWKPDF